MEFLQFWSERLAGLGSEPENLSFLQMSVRGAIIFLAALLMVRLGDKRFLSRKTAFDAVLGFILASTMARAINGSAAFLPTIGAGFVIVLLHRIFAHLSIRHHWLGWLVKGSDDVVIKDGQVDQRALRQNDFSERDLLEDLRRHGVESPAEVKTARIERNGEVSVIRR